MRMMYKLIAREIEEAGLEDTHPTDFLSFYCIGKKRPFSASVGSIEFQIKLQYSDSNDY